MDERLIVCVLMPLIDIRKTILYAKSENIRIRCHDYTRTNDFTLFKENVFHFRDNYISERGKTVFDSLIFILHTRCHIYIYLVLQSNNWSCISCPFSSQIDSHEYESNY
jgi:hypothetical protein